MPTRYYFRATQDNPNAGGLVYDLSETQGTDDSLGAQVNTDTDFVTTILWRSPDLGGADLEADVPISLNITAVQGSTAYRWRLNQVDSGGNVIGSSDWTAERTSTGVQTATLQAPNTEDYYQIEIEFQSRRTGGMPDNNSVTIAVSDADSYLDVEMEMPVVLVESEAEDTLVAPGSEADREVEAARSSEDDADAETQEADREVVLPRTGEPVVPPPQDDAQGTSTSLRAIEDAVPQVTAEGDRTVSAEREPGDQALVLDDDADRSVNASRAAEVSLGPVVDQAATLAVAARQAQDDAAALDEAERVVEAERVSVDDAPTSDEAQRAVEQARGLTENVGAPVDEAEPTLEAFRVAEDEVPAPTGEAAHGGLLTSRFGEVTLPPIEDVATLSASGSRLAEDAAPVQAEAARQGVFARRSPIPLVDV